MIELEKLTSTSVLIKWNNVTFSSFTDGSSAEADVGPSASSYSKNSYYKLGYWLKSDPENVVTHDELTKSELQLTGLHPNSDYILQIVAFGATKNGPMTSEIALKHFRTLIDDIKVPANLQVTRLAPDKLNIKWEPVVLYDPTQTSQSFNLIKSYRIYYKEIAPNSSEEPDYYHPNDEAQMEAHGDDWQIFDTKSADTEFDLLDLNVNSDYAIKVAAVDHLNNEGPESEVKTAYSISEEAARPVFEPSASVYSSEINDAIGKPLDLKIIEYTSTSVKFSWRSPPPVASNGHTAPIKNFLISYVDKEKSFKESNGKRVSYLSGLVMTVRVPARDDPKSEINWLVASLVPNTEYEFNISALMENKVQGPAIMQRVQTRRDRPYRVDAPLVEEVYADSTVLIRTGNASERNGPIRKYWLVVTPLIEQDTAKHKSNFETREKDLGDLLRYSTYDANMAGSQMYANDSTFIAAEFEAAHWPPRFILGDGRLYGRFFNRHLVKGIEYKAYIIAFTDEGDSQATARPNMLGLGEILNAKSTGFVEGELYSSSVYSEKFSIVIASDLGMGKQVKIFPLSIKDPQALFWAAGLIIAALILLVTICCLSRKGKQQKKLTNEIRLGDNNTILMNGRGTSSTMSSHLNSKQLEATVNNKTGTVTTNTIKAGGITKHNINLVNPIGNGQNMVTTASSSSSSSSTTASPTTALLSCSVNNNSNPNVCGSGSQNSANTNNTHLNSLLTTGLLTTASPMRIINNNTSPISTNLMAANPSESLYTSIEVTQKLLQQQLIAQATNTNPYDNNNQLMMMMMMNGQSTFAPNPMSTLTRNMMANTMSMNHYDPIELRRIQYQTQAMQTHPPVHVDELFQHIERLKAQNNAKFSLEYESIEPGQQFQWEHSTFDLNRAKNRYANVIAYDHSRVALTKLPEQCFLNTSPYSQSTLQRSFTGADMGYYGNAAGLGTPPLPPPPPPPPGVQLPSPSVQANFSDYINANYLDGYRKRNAYIGTQGPLPNTVGDFWRMVWEQQCCTVVMMTKLEERNRLKCDQYWPSKGTEVYANCIQVTLVDFTELSTYSVRTFVIAPVNQYAQLQMAHNSTNMNFELRREVKHFQYTGWPDHGVPDHPTSFLMFIRRVRNANPADSGPVVAHCSAGVGRTGCFVVIDTMLERLRHEKTVDVYGHVTCLRAQRNYMVQTEDQYVFCYDAVLEACQSGHTEVPARSLYQHLQRLLQLSADEPGTMLTEMELEYKRLSNIKAPQSKFQSANLASNKFKNRLVNILPYEATRVCLQHLPNVPEAQGSDYINANFVDGYKYKRAYIATQAPLTETIDDFWRMLWEHNSTIIVMLTKLREMGREKCAQYWPNERSIRYQYFVVDPIAEYNMSQYILREFKVTDARDGQSRTIRQFQFVDWPEQGVPKSGESIIELIGQVHKTKEQFGQTGPITVHCSAGVGRTGVFITLGIVLERTRYEGMIDVFNTVKVLRNQRPAMVQTEDQYQFCYRAALEYLGSYDNYEWEWFADGDWILNNCFYFQFFFFFNFYTANKFVKTHILYILYDNNVICYIDLI